MEGPILTSLHTKETLRDTGLQTSTEVVENRHFSRVTQLGFSQDFPTLVKVAV
jgi:hypothetical protein